MKVNVIGGGPAGLYFAILYKKAWPQARITVYERNRPDDTFGFGVVFSDQTLETFQNYDLESYRSITENFAYWDDIEIHFKGTVHRIGGNGFCGCSRATLLQLLHQRAQALGVEIKFQHDVDRHRRPNCATPIWSSDRTASIRACAKPSRTISSRISTCGRTSSPGWARPGRSMPSPSSSRRRNTASSSSTPISMSPAARPGSSKPIRRRSRRWASIRWTSPAPPN